MPKVFNDFSGGWSGSLDLAKIPDSMYDATNLIVYRDGSIGPRPGLREFNLGRTTAGKVHGAFYTGGDLPFSYVDGLNVWAVSAENDGVGSTDIGDIVAAPENDLPIKFIRAFSRVGVISVPGDDLYHYLGSTILALGAGDAGLALTHYVGEYLIRTDLLADTGDFVRPSIYYTAPGDPLDWPALNFISLPTLARAIVGLFNQRNHLTIITDEGAFFVLTGAPGINDVLRRIAYGQAEPTPIGMEALIHMNGDELIYYVSPNGNNIATFDGAEHNDLRYLTFTPDDPSASYADATDYTASHKKIKSIQGADTSSPGFIYQAPQNKMLLKHNGAWGYHEFAQDVGLSWAYDGRGRVIGFAPQQAAANTPAYCFDLNLNRPAFTDDTHARPGDLSDTPLENSLVLAEQWTETGDHVQVKEIVVDFKAWNTGVTNNSFTVKVECLARGGAEVDNDNHTATWTQAATAFTTAGVEMRERFQFGIQGQGGGYRVSLLNLVGVAIREVVVVDGDQENNGRAY